MLPDELVGKSLREASQERAVHISFSSTRVFSAVLCSSFHKEILSSSDIIDASSIEVNHLKRRKKLFKLMKFTVTTLVAQKK